MEIGNYSEYLENKVPKNRTKANVANWKSKYSILRSTQAGERVGGRSSKQIKRNVDAFQGTEHSQLKY